MEMENNSTTRFHSKGKVLIKTQGKTLIVTNVYYMKNTKNIIIMTKLMEKGFMVKGEKDQFVIKKEIGY